MNIMNTKPSRFFISWFLAPALAVFIAGCQSTPKPTPSAAAVPTPPAPPVAATPPAPPTAPVIAAQPTTPTVVRIKAGSTAAFTDSKGNVWAAEQGFSGGDSIERPDLTITNTPDQGIYRSEHYSMDSFSTPLANGKYVVKLHFCETYEGITGPGQRVFTFKVQDHEFKDFDVWVKAGGPFTAYVESVPVEITDNKLLITFTPNVENPQINGIEILPQP